MTVSKSRNSEYKNQEINEINEEEYEKQVTDPILKDQSKKSTGLGRTWEVVKGNKKKIVGGVIAFGIVGLVLTTIFVPSMNHFFHTQVLTPVSKGIHNFPAFYRQHIFAPIANWYSHTVTPFVKSHSALLKNIGEVAGGFAIGVGSTLGIIGGGAYVKTKYRQIKQHQNRLFSSEDE